jgi:hypothetical protein
VRKPLPEISRTPKQQRRIVAAGGSQTSQQQPGFSNIPQVLTSKQSTDDMYP